jgi:uncharacterized protein (DUF885 family)
MAALVLVATTAAQDQEAIDNFFRDFSAEWIRGNPNQATATRYFTGPEQERLERQLTPVTAEWRRARVELARRGLSELGKFDRADVTDDQQVSADVMRWQLNVIVDEAPYDHYSFPLEQFGGVNVDLVNTLTVGHPLLTGKDAQNYLARQIPLRPEQMTRFRLRTLVHHETVPGHHFQLALELENEASPRFRQVRAFGAISALSEGWALYAERLAAESWWYDDDPEGLVGQLDDELFRARRLVVDTGLHAKRGTREQAIAYGIEPSEVERYVVNPGQACSYMIGQLKIFELREKARKALGGRFSLKEFHGVVLGTGTAPLDVLERQVDAYVRSTLKSEV